MSHDRDHPPKIFHAKRRGAGVVFRLESLDLDQRRMQLETFREQLRRLAGAEKRAVPNFVGSESIGIAEKFREPLDLPAAFGTQRTLGVLVRVDGVGMANQVESHRRKI